MKIPATLPYASDDAAHTFVADLRALGVRAWLSSGFVRIPGVVSTLGDDHDGTFMFGVPRYVPEGVGTAAAAKLVRVDGLWLLITGSLHYLKTPNTEDLTEFAGHVRDCVELAHARALAEALE